MQEHILTGRDAMSIVHLPPCTEIECQSGVVWVTFTGDRMDYVIRPGQRLRVDRGRNAVISAIGGALEPSRFSVSRDRVCLEESSAPWLSPATS
ncbi:MAG TPA: DUF2917 domain-containing protein [Spirochaetia bacterium]|nr:DUF2917 domain-containing protein [Spirochaetia bacterium]